MLKIATVTTKMFDSIIMLSFRQTKVGIEKFYGAKTPIKIFNINVDNIMISK